MTSAQRRNAKMDRIFEEAKIHKAKYAPLRSIKVLERMTEKVERLNSLQHSGGRISAEDLAELSTLTKEARVILDDYEAGCSQIKSL